MRSMRRALLVALIPLALLVVPSAASAHYITSSSLTCEGAGFSWAGFSQGDNKFVLKWWNGTTQTVDGWTGSNGTGTTGPIPLPVIPPNGTDVSVVGTWTADGGGSFDASQTLSCQPVVTNASVTCSGLMFTWASSVPSPTIGIAWSPPSWGSTKVSESGQSGTTSIPLPQTPPNGTVVTVVLSWPGGSQSVSSAPTNCVPPPPPPPPPPPTPTPPPTLTPPVPPAPPTPPTPPTPPVPPRHHHHHHHHHPHAVRVTLSELFFNQDPVHAARTTKAAPYGCRIAGPPATLKHGLAHWRVTCRSAQVLKGWKWYVDGRLARSKHWTYTTNGGRQLNSWLFDASVWRIPNVWGHYTIKATGRVLPRVVVRTNRSSWS